MKINAQASNKLLQSGSATNAEWQFAVSGDSRNCGDIVMPSIAREISRTKAEFYWHLGDLRAIRSIDEDIAERPGDKPSSISDYRKMAWQDFIDNQISAFKTPFFLGIGNHETIPPKTRSEFITQFTAWLNAPVIQEQRLRDDPTDKLPKSYYHWRQSGVEFIYLDNATTDEFDDMQMNWFEKVLERSEADPAVTTIIVGMHEALPESLAANHSMNKSSAGLKSGHTVYQSLLRAQNQWRKKVYVLASHSHFYMENIFNSAYWKTHGGVLPGWIVGTAGAVRYKLPDGADPLHSKTNVYGYLLATVNPANELPGTVRFDFKELKEADMPDDIKMRYGKPLVDWCFENNSQAPK